jgi:hypothetical protein
MPRDRRAALTRFYTKIFEADPVDRNPAPAPTHKLSMLADLVMEAAGVDRASALHWLIHNSNGRTFAQQHKADTMPREEFMASVVKQYGAVAVAKHVLETGVATNITEHEFVAACGDDFVKLYSANSEDGLTMRKAVEVIKQAQFAKSRGPEPHLLTSTSPATLAPSQVGGAAAQDIDDGVDAYTQLAQLAERQGKSFAQVYEAPENQKLASLERRQARDRLQRTLPLMPS